MTTMDEVTRARHHKDWIKDMKEAGLDLLYVAPWLPLGGLALYGLARALPPGIISGLFNAIGQVAIAVGLVFAVWQVLVILNIGWHLWDTRPPPKAKSPGPAEPAVSGEWSSPDAPLADLLDGPGPVVPFERDETEIVRHSPPG